MMELVKNTKIDFMGLKKYAFAFSGAASSPSRDRNAASASNPKP